MNDLRLSELRKKSNKWFREYGIVHKGERTSIKALKYMAERSFEALPKKYKEYLIEDKERIIDVTAHAVAVDGENGQWDMYQSMLERAKFEYRHSGDRTAEYIYKAFREQYPKLYKKYNSYMYRNGHSASQYFKQNFDGVGQGKEMIINIELPKVVKGVYYQMLYIEFDWSGKLITTAYML